jgi:hypothetical protein
MFDLQTPPLNRDPFVPLQLSGSKGFSIYFLGIGPVEVSHGES